MQKSNCKNAKSCYNRNCRNAETEEKGGNVMFDKRKLQAVMLLKGKKVEDISKVLGVNESTIYRKLNNDGDFSRSEIEKLVVVDAKVADLAADLVQAFGVKA